MENFIFQKIQSRKNKDKAIVFCEPLKMESQQSQEIDLKENKEMYKEIKEGEYHWIQLSKTDIKIIIPRLDAWKVSTDEKFIKGFL